MNILYETPKKCYLLECDKDLSTTKAETLGSDEIKSKFQIKQILEFENLEESEKYFLDIEKGIFNEKLREFLEKNDVKEVICDKIVAEVLKKNGLEAKHDIWIYRSLQKFQNEIFNENFYQTYLGLSHTISRGKISSVIGKEDNFIVQSIIMIDQLDVDIRLYSSRLKELYGWYFPELERLKSTEDYVICANKMQRIRSLEKEEILKLSKELEVDLETINNSIGVELSDFDWSVIKKLGKMLEEKIDNRNDLKTYLKKKIKSVAPNLGALVGDSIAARLIQQSGSLQNLSSYPSSTIQLLGAEKALFRSLKTKSVTPKYGLIYNTGIVKSTRIKYRGRISRSLATKIAIVSRIDCYSEGKKTEEYGRALRKLLAKTTECYEKNKKPERTYEVIERVFNELKKKL